MAYVKLSDDLWSNPKINAVGDSALGLYTRLLSYCGCHLTDGLIPTVMVEMLVGKNRKGLDALVNGGLIVRLESGGLLIHDFLDHNRSKADWDLDRKQRRENGARGGRPRASVNGQ